MKRLILIIAITLILIPMGGTADEIMLVGGKLTWVKSYNGDDGRIQNESVGSFQGVTATVRGSVRCSINSKNVDGAMIRSTGIGATVSNNGQYLMSELPGDWTVTVTKTGYIPRSKSLHIDHVDQQIVLDFLLNCYDQDYDRICDFEDPSSDMDEDGILDGLDNCPYVPNGPQKGTCMWGSRKGYSCRTLDGCGCSSDAQGGCELQQFEFQYQDGGFVCSDDCMDDPDTNACKYILY